MTDDVQMAIAQARWHARPWLLVSVGLIALHAKERREARNRELRRLHLLGAVRCMSEDPADFGKALR